MTRQEYAALQRDERVPEKQKYTTIEPKDISSEVESAINLPESESKVTEIKFLVLWKQKRGTCALGSATA